MTVYQREIYKGPFTYERCGDLFIATVYGYGICGILDGWRTLIGWQTP